MTMVELLIKDAKAIGASAVTVRQAEWGGWYVAILGGRVSQIFDTQDEAQCAASEFITKVAA
jgi:hypothetical protein